MNKDDISDEDLLKQINETKAELKSIESPQIIESDTSLDPEVVEEFYEKMKKMPRDKLSNLLANLGRNHKDLGNSHQFTGMTDRAQKSAKQRLREKLSYLQMKRKTKVSIEKEMEKIDKQKEHKKKENTEHGENYIDAEEVEELQNNECDAQQKIQNETN